MRVCTSTASAIREDRVFHRDRAIQGPRKTAVTLRRRGRQVRTGHLPSSIARERIAYEIGVSEATVKAHVSAVLRKLGVRSRA